MNLHNLLYNNSTKVTPQRGSLLIADPMMEEVYFRRSVVMILDVDEDRGHLGLTLNKTTRLTLKDLMPDWETGKTVPVYCGGPVDLERLFLLHTLGDIIPDAIEIVPGIYVGGDVEKILEYIEMGGEIENRLRFFLGYSGWSNGQLKSEIAGHSWAVRTPTQGENLLEGSENDYRRREVEKLGEAYRSWLVVPQDPSFN